jgi:hypothetical protein
MQECGNMIAITVVCPIVMEVIGQMYHVSPIVGILLVMEAVAKLVEGEPKQEP